MEKKDFGRFSLSQETLKALKKLGYDRPTEVQEKVMPLVFRGRDLIVRSQTGSGKTAAFAIPICEKLELEKRYPQVLVLAPTRELAVQVKEDFSHLGRFRRIRCAAVYGKQPMEIQKRELRQRVHVVVGTPGRTMDHIQRENLILDEIKYLVIDEADKMLDMGFIDQVEAIVRLLPQNRATLLFSATMPEAIEDICRKYMKKPQRIEVVSRVSTTEKIKQYCYRVEDPEKFNLLKKLIYVEKPESCIIFCNTREKVEELLRGMKSEGFYCEGLHGGMEQDRRLAIVKDFKRGEFHFLIATDVAARGIHIDDVTHVINYEVPMESESYIHRIGRTGRVENRGVAITFAAQGETRFLSQVEEFIGYNIPIREEPAEAEVKKARSDFEDKIKSRPKAKKSKTELLNREITKIRINAGKTKKMRPGDILGAISNIKGVNPEDIGIIDVQDTCSYVEIFGKDADYIVRELQDTSIKGKTHTVKRVRFRS